MSATESFKKAQDLRGASLSTFIASLSVSIAIFGAELVVFFFIRRKFPNLYGSLNYDVIKDKASKFIRFEWNQGDNLDLYFFRRYLRTIVLVFLPTSLVVTPILASINFLHGKKQHSRINGLDQLGWSNIGLDQTGCYWAHFFLSICFTVYVCWIVWIEMHTYVRIRQKAQAAVLCTVLIDCIPESWASEDKLRERLACFGQITLISFNQDCSLINRKVRQREQTTRLLEKAQTHLIKSKIWKMRRNNRFSLNLREAFLGGQARIESYSKQLLALNDEIDRLSCTLPALPSAFVTFSTPLAASMACQSVIHCNATNITPRTLPTSPNDVIWDNVSMPWWCRKVRVVICNAVILLLSLLCAAPISLSSLLSQAVYLSHIKHLHWLQQLPRWTLGIIQGLLPPIILSILLRIFSGGLVFLVRKQGLPLKSLSSVKIQDYYFFFLLVQVTISVTLSAGITVFLSEVVSGDKIAVTLAQNLPKASNYFLSYIILQGLSISASSLLRLDCLINLKIIGPLLDSTVTEIIERGKLSRIEWGTFLPVYTNLACIGLLYAIISPIIIPFQLFIFILSWTIHIQDIPNLYDYDQGGLFYPKALEHLLIGLYLMEASLLLLFSLIRDSYGKAACIGQTILSALAIALTIVYHYITHEIYRPLLLFLPSSAELTKLNNYTPFYKKIPRATHLRLPKDKYGFCDQELNACQNLSPGIVLSSKDAQILKNGSIQLYENI